MEPCHSPLVVNHTTHPASVLAFSLLWTKRESRTLCYVIAFLKSLFLFFKKELLFFLNSGFKS
jgi:hypothetical protein